MTNVSIRSNWRLSVSSALLCALAFNLTFLLQELLLVIPKALTPGLYPILFHNNHTWTGHNPVARLLQGTGMLADLASGLVFSALLVAFENRPLSVRLFVFWMAFQGFFLGLPQVVIGAFVPANDVGMAMDYLHLSEGEKFLAGSIAVGVMAGAGYWLAQRFIRSMATLADSAGGAACVRFAFQAASLPALVSIALVVPFREPREATEVLLVPLIVTLSGAALGAGKRLVDEARRPIRTRARIPRMAGRGARSPAGDLPDCSASGDKVFLSAAGGGNVARTSS